jgi:hypothetical protein
LAKKKQQELRRCLREVENLSDTEEEVVYIYEPEELISVKCLIDCQEGRDEFSKC